MMTGRTVTLGAVCRLVNGKAFKPSDWSESGVPIIRIQNLNGSTKPFNYFTGSLANQVRVKPGDLLLAWSGTPGTSFGAHIWGGEEAILNQHIFRCDIDKTVITEDWARFTINAQLGQLIELAHGGVGLKHVTRRMVEDLKIPLPSVPDQRRVMEVLDEAEALRGKRRVSMAVLNTVSQSIFLEMFGDPVGNAHQYRTSRLIDLVDPERGISYGVVQRGDDIPNGVPLVRITDVVSGEIVLDALKRTSPSIARKYHRTVLRGGELVISIRGTVGRCARVPSELAGGNITRELALIPHRGVNTAFLLELLRSDAIQRLISGDVKGVAQRGINLADLRDLSVILPQDQDVANFASRVAIVDALKAAHRASLSQLDALFATLQHRAFAGSL